MCIRRIIVLALTLVLCASVSAWGTVAINETNFPDQVFRGCVKGSFDINPSDNSLSDDEIAAVTSMNIGNMNISSLKGIKHFTSLQVLYCDYSSLESLDLSGLKSLKTLYCSNGKLVSLDISDCSALETLYCNDNKLTTLDLSGLKSLKTLYCSNGKLVSLDVSGCTALETVYCSGYNFNEGRLLKYINLSGCTALKTLYCTLGQLTTLDVSECTALETLQCLSNNLTSLDLSKNTNLKSLACDNNQLTHLDLSKCTALNDVICYGNKLTSLDLGDCSTLRQLTCYENQLTTINWSNYTNLVILECYDNHITSLDLSGCTSMSILQCYDNKLVSLNVTGCTSLDEIFCNSNLLTSLDVSTNPNLRQLSCYDNQLTKLDISKNTKLGGLSCENNQLTSLDVTHNPDLNAIVCSNNQLTALDVTNQTKLVVLYCSDNRLTELNVSTNPELSFLECANNQLTQLDLSHNTVLANLYCYSNDLTSLDVSNNKRLRTLLCSNNSIAKLNVSMCYSLDILACDDNQLVALDLSRNTILQALSCDSQTAVLASPDITLKAPYIYSINMNALKTSLDLSDDIAGFIANFGELDVKGHSGETVNYSSDISAGRIYFDKKPNSISYSYNVNSPTIANTYMSVAATMQGDPETTIYIPQISTDSLPDAAAGKSYSANISADGYPPLFWSIYSGSLPEGLSIDREHGTISGTPVAEGEEAQLSFTVYVSNDFGSTSKDFTLTVKTLPVIQTSSLSSGKRNESYSASFTATGSTPITWSADKLPPGLSISSSSGAISGTPTQKGTFSVDIIASNVVGSVTKTFSLLINPAASEIELNSTNFPDNTFREYISENIDTDGDNYLDDDDIASVTQLNLSELNIAELTGIEKFSALVSLDCSYNNLTGTLSLASNTKLVYLNCSHNSLTALDLSNCTALSTLLCGENQIAALDLSKNTNLTSLESDPQAISITSPDVNTDSTYPYSLSLSALNLSVTSAAFISNALSIDVKGHYSETVNYSSDSSAGIIYFENKPKTMTYQYATGRTGKYMNVALKFGGSADNSRYLPQILTSELPDAISGVSYSADIEAKGYTPLFWSISSGTLPEGLSIDRTTGTISGTPAAEGEEAQTSFTVYVSNDFGNTSQALTLAVKTAPLIRTSSLADGRRNESYSASLTATGSTPITWSADNLPQGMAISSDTGTIYGTPTQTGTFSVDITASNIAGYDSQTFSLVITASVSAISISSDNFPDSAFREYISKNLDTDGDNYLESDEINSVTYMDLRSRDIADLTGIEHFSALISLDCSRNNIASLDVSAFTSLQYLYCQENMLSELDLSLNTSLVYLSASYNRLAALDLSANSLLSSMDCSPQSFTISADESALTGYPYVIDLNSAKSALGLSISVTEFAANVSGLAIYTSADQEITRSSDIEAGIIYLAEEPARLTYNYDTGAALSDPAMSVAVTTLTPAHPQNSSGSNSGSESSSGSDSNSGSDSSSGGGSSTPSTNSGSSSPSVSDQDEYTPPTVSSDITPSSGDIAQVVSEDITDVSGDIAQVVSGDTGQASGDVGPGEDGNTTANNGGGEQVSSWSSAERISSTSAFMDLLGKINSGSEPPGKYYVLDADLNISSISDWQPIGTAANPFRGHFNGAGKTVTCTAPVSMFGVINTDGIAVQNLRVRMYRNTNASVSSSSVRASAITESAGGLTTQLISGIIDNCTFDGTIYSEGDDSAAGGLVGELSGGTVRNCKTSQGSEVYAGYSAGGIVGYVSAGEITGCSSNAEVYARYSGGIAGYSEAERQNINSNSFTLADYEVGSDAFGLELTPSDQSVIEGSYITAIEFSAENMTRVSFVVEGNYDLGLTLGDNAIYGMIPPGTPSGRYTVTVNAFNTDGSRISGQAYINVLKSSGRIQPDSSRSNFMDYIFTLPSSVRSKLTSLFRGENIYQLTEDDIIARTWQLSDSDLNEISGMNMQVIMNLPAIRPSRSGVYVMKITLWEVNAGTRINIQGLSGYSDVTSSALDRMEYVLLDEDGREISAVPESKVIYAAMRLSSGRTHRGTIIAPNDLKLGTIQAVTIDQTLLEKIADTVKISADRLRLLSDDNISDPQEPTQAIRDEIESEEKRIIGKMNTLTVSQDGYYICKVTLSDDLYESIKGVKIEDLNVYVLYDDERTEASEFGASFITGLLNTWELLSLNGEKLEFGAKEFLMVGFLNAGTPFSVYLTKLLIALLLGGCDAGFGLAGLGGLAVGIILLMRRKR